MPTTAAPASVPAISRLPASSPKDFWLATRRSLLLAGAVLCMPSAWFGGVQPTNQAQVTRCPRREVPAASSPLHVAIGTDVWAVVTVGFNMGKQLLGSR
jgi:hypothetical protein